MNVRRSNDLFPLPMSEFNRLQNPTFESVALICVKRGEVIVIEDEPETRIHKDCPLLIHVTLTNLLEQINDQFHEGEEELYDLTMSMSASIFFSPKGQNGGKK